jgi:diadenosine tetraphosphatase ApaH/serine/threonine PP2A family protein phosphatase
MYIISVATFGTFCKISFKPIKCYENTIKHCNEKKSITVYYLILQKAQLPVAGRLCNLTWSDPDEIYGYALSERGPEYRFGNKPTTEFYNNNRLSLIAWAHQLAYRSYEFDFKHAVKRNSIHRSRFCTSGRSTQRSRRDGLQRTPNGRFA